MANKVGPLIKEARTAAGMTQEQLAKKVDGLTAADLSKAERGEKELPQATLKLIAKATGVTQTSLVEAAKNSTYGTAKTSTAKTSTAKKTTTAKTTASKTSSAKKSTSSKNDLELTAAEKKLVELYRAADSDTKKAAVSLLKGEKTDNTGDILSGLLGSAMELLGGKDK